MLPSPANHIKVKCECAIVRKSLIPFCRHSNHILQIYFSHTNQSRRFSNLQVKSQKFIKIWIKEHNILLLPLGQRLLTQKPHLGTGYYDPITFSGQCCHCGSCFNLCSSALALLIQMMSHSSSPVPIPVLFTSHGVCSCCWFPVTLCMLSVISLSVHPGSQWESSGSPGVDGFPWAPYISLWTAWCTQLAWLCSLGIWVLQFSPTIQKHIHSIWTLNCF